VEGLTPKKPFMGEVWIFSGTTHSDLMQPLGTITDHWKTELVNKIALISG